MSKALTADQRVLHARHLLLADIGEQGQSALCAARLAMPDRADARASEVAADYLRRAGVQVGPPDEPVHAGQRPTPAVANAAEVRQLAGDPAQYEAAAALAGAFAAVEAIKAAVGAGTPGTLPRDFELA